MKACKITLLLLALAAGCSSPRPLRPGTATIKSIAPAAAAQFVAELKQPENPAQPAAQNFERTMETETPLPAGTRIQERIVTPDPEKPAAPPAIKEKTIVLAEPTVEKTRTIEKAGTTIGASQKDTARELATRLSSMKPILWIGLAMAVFGIASLACPPLRAIVGSVTTSVAIMAGGFALMILPTLVAGHELLILSAVALSVGTWFLAHRHGALKAEATAAPKNPRVLQPLSVNRKS